MKEDGTLYVRVLICTLFFATIVACGLVVKDFLRNKYSNKEVVNDTEMMVDPTATPESNVNIYIDENNGDVVVNIYN